MARYTTVLKSLAHNAVGARRIQAVAPAEGSNYYVTGATLNDGTYVLSLARNGGLSDVTVNLSALSDAANPGGSSNDVQYNNAGSFGGITLAKGKILSANGSGVPTTLAAGTDGYALVADSTAATGLNWASNSDANYYTSAGTLGNDSILTGTIAGGGSNWTASFATIYDTNISGTFSLSGSDLGGSISRADTNEVQIKAGTTEQIRLGVSNSYLKGTNWHFAGSGYMRISGTNTQLQFEDDEHYIYSDGTDLHIKTTTTASQDIALTSTGKLAVDAGDDINLDAHTGLTNFRYRGIETFRIAAGASSPVVLQPKASGFDLAMSAQDGTEVLRLDSANKRIGIGTTAPSEKLDIQGSILVDPSTGSDTAGTSAGIKFNAQDDSGVGWNLRLGDSSDDGDFNIDRLYSSTWYKSASIDRSTGDFIWYDDDGSTAKMLWDASTNRLGIGTTSPSQYLEIYESGTSNNNLLLLKNEHASGRGTYITHTNIGGTTIEGLTGDSSGDFIIKNKSAAGEIRLGTNDTDRMTIDIDGKVGIGTVAPTEKFDVRSGVSNTVALFKSDDNRGLIQVADDDTTISLVAEGTKASIGTVGSLSATNLNIDNAGKVGIGTTAPGALLHIDSDTTGDVEVLRLENSNASTTSIDSVTQSFRLRRDQDDYSYHAAKLTAVKEQGWTNSSATVDASLTFSTIQNETTSEKMRITSAGKVGIGTTAPAELLSVVGGNILLGSNNQYLQFVNAAGTQYDAIGYDGSNDLNFNSPSDTIFKRNGTEKMRLSASDLLGIGTASPEGILHTANNSGVNIFQRSNDSASYGTNFYIRKSRGTVGSESNTQSGDLIGQIGFSPYYGDYDNYAASISSAVEGTLGTDTTPGRLMFSTAAAGANTVTERMRIDSAGNVGIGTTSPSYTLDVYKADADGNPTINIADGDKYLRFYIDDESYIQSDDSLYMWARGTNKYAMLRSENSYVKLRAGSSQNLVFAPNDTDYMTHDSGGLNLSGSIQLVDGYITSNPGANHLWASGSTLYWGSSEIDTSADSGTIGGSIADNQVAFGASTANSIEGSADLTWDGANFNIAGSSPKIIVDGGGSDDASIELRESASYGGRMYYDGDSGVFMKFTTIDGGTEKIRMAYDRDGNMYLGSADANDTTSNPNMFIDEGGKVGIGTTSPTYTLDVRASDYNVALISGAGNGNYPIFHVIDSADISTALFESNRAGDQSSRISLWHNPASAHEGSHTAIKFQMNNDQNAKHTYGQVLAGIDDYTEDTEDGYLAFSQIKAGSLTEGMRINSTGVGIGTTTPAFALDVNGDIRIEDAHYLRFGDDDSDSQWAIQHAGADLNFAEVGIADNVLFLEAGGRVGVGTNNPDGGWLHVNSAGTDQTLKLESTDGNVDAVFKDSAGSGIIRFSDDKFEFYTDSGYSNNPINFRDDKVGIGTQVPSNKLHVLSTTTPQARVAYDGTYYMTTEVSSAGSTTWTNQKSFRFTGEQTDGVFQIDQNKIGLVRDTDSAASSVFQIGDHTTYDQFSIVEDQRGSSATNGLLYLRSKKTGNYGYATVALGAISGSNTSYLYVNGISTNEAFRFDTNSKSHALDIAKAGYVSIGAAVSTTDALYVNGDTTINGTLSATAKSFNIEHPLYKDKRLVHGSLEGPEHGIYIRGSIESKEYGCLIELPEYWEAMCEDYTVQLTPHGPYTVYIKEKQKDKVMVACTSKDYKFDYYIVGSRTDETLEVVQDA